MGSILDDFEAVASGGVRQPRQKKTTAALGMFLDDFEAVANGPQQQTGSPAAPQADNIKDTLLGYGGDESDNAIERGFHHLGSQMDYAKGMTSQDYAEAARSIADTVKYQKDNPKSAEAREIGKAWDEGGEGWSGIIPGVRNVVGEMVKDIREAPSVLDATKATGKNLQALGGGIVEQMPNMLPPMAGMVAGGVAGAGAGSAIPVVGTTVGAGAGGWAGATAGNTLVEGQGIALNALAEAGIDPMDTERVSAFLKENAASLFGMAATKGAIIGLVDTLTAGLGGRIITAPARAASRRALTDMGVDLADRAAVKQAMKSEGFAKRIFADEAFQALKHGAANFGRNAAAAGLEPAGEFAGEFVGSGVAEGRWDAKEAALEAMSSIGQSGVTFAGQKAYQVVTKPEEQGPDTEANRIRNQTVLALKQSNLPTEDLMQMRGQPEELARYGLTVEDIDVVINDRNDDLQRAKAVLLDSGESGPMTRAATLGINAEQAKIVMQREKDRVDSTRGRYFGTADPAAGPHESASDLLLRAEGDIDWDKQSLESSLYKKRRNLPAEDYSGVELPPSADEKADALVRQMTGQLYRPELAGDKGLEALVDEIRSEDAWDRQQVASRVYNQRRNQPEEDYSGIEVPEPREDADVRRQAPGTAGPVTDGQPVEKVGAALESMDYDWESQQRAAGLYNQARNRKLSREEQNFLAAYENQDSTPPGPPGPPPPAGGSGGGAISSSGSALHNRPRAQLTPEEIADLDPPTGNLRPENTRDENLISGSGVVSQPLTTKPVVEHETANGEPQMESAPSASAAPAASAPQGATSVVKESFTTQSDLSGAETAAGVVSDGGPSPAGRVPEGGAGKVPESGAITEGGVTYELSDGGRTAAAAAAEDGSGRSAVSERSGPVIYHSKGTRITPNQRKALRAHHAKIGTLKSDIDTVDHEAHAAHILRPLGRRAQETAMALILDKDNRPISVVQHSVGGPTSTQVFTGVLVGAVHNTKGAASVWLAHNHPSGTRGASGLDIKLIRRMENAIAGTGVKHNGHIIVTPDGGGVAYGPDGQFLADIDTNEAAGTAKPVKITERRLTGEGPGTLAEYQIQSPDDMKQALRDFGDGREGVLLLNSRSQPVEFIPISTREMRALREGEKKGIAARIYRAIDRHPVVRSAGAVVKDGGGEAIAALKNLTTFLAQADVDVLDAMTDKEGRMSSMANSGILMKDMVAEGGVFYSMAEADEETESFSPKYSIRSWTEEEKNEVVNTAKRFKISEKKAKKWIRDIDNVMAIILNDPSLDFDATAAGLYTALKANSDPHYTKSLDFSTLCRKRYVLAATIERVQMELGRAVDKDNWAAIRGMLKKKGITVSCGACYVDSKRMEQGKFVNQWLDSHPDVDPQLALTQAGIDRMKRESPDLYKDFKKKVGSNNSKTTESRVDYYGEIRSFFGDPRHGPKRVLAFNRRSGLRWQSWSDFEVPHLMDAMQAILDMAMVGLKGHAYTKVPEFVEAMGKTGLMINMSLVPKGNGFNADGSLAFDPVEGMPFERALELRDKYPNTVGTIAIGIGNDHVRALLDDPRVDYVIPYHTSGLARKFQEMYGMGSWEDFTKTQTAAIADTQKFHDTVGKDIASLAKFVDGKGKVIDPADYAKYAKNNGLIEPDFDEYWSDRRSGAANAGVYLKMMADRGALPKFRGHKFAGNRFLEDFTRHPNYWKLLIDRKSYTPEGKNIRQDPVVPDYDAAAIRAIYDNYEPAPDQADMDTVQEFLNEHSSQELAEANSDTVQVRGELAEILGEEGVRKLLEAGTVRLIGDQDRAKQIIGRMKKRNVKHSIRYSKNGKIQGFTAGKKVYLVQDGIAKGKAFSVLKHELGIHLRQGLLNNEQFRALLKSLEERIGEDSPTGAAIRAARARVPKGTRSEHVWEETLAYMVEAHPDNSLVKKFVRIVKDILRRIGLDIKSLTVDDINDLALAAIRVEVEKEVKGVTGYKPVDVNSPEFKRWFGLGSNIVDATGKPRRFFHGTDASGIESFKRSSYGAMGPGIYFGLSPETVETYAPEEGGAVYPVYVRGKYLSNEEWTEYIRKHGWEGAEAAATKDGYAGVMDTMMEDAVVVWDPSNIKSATSNTGEFSDADSRINHSEIAAAKAIFSKLEQVASFDFTGMKAQGVLNFLGKKGVKKAEIEATGLDAWLTAKKPTDKVTHQELSDFVRANMVEVEDVVLGDGQASPKIEAVRISDLEIVPGFARGYPKSAWVVFRNDDPIYVSEADSANAAMAEYSPENDDDYDESMSTQFDQYTEPGWKAGSYREFFVTAPRLEGKPGTRRIEVSEVVESSDGWNVFLIDGGMVAVSFNEASSADQAIEIAKKEFVSGGLWEDGHPPYEGIENPIVRIRFNTVTVGDKKILRIEEMQGPSAGNQRSMPSYLRDNTYQIGTKRIIAYAKEQGFDGITFAMMEGRSAGETQADRYSLEKQVSRVEAHDIGGGMYNVFADDLDGKRVIEKKSVPENELPGLVGKELASKIVNSEYRRSEFTGLDLAVGGTGLKRLYDESLPKMLEAYGKEKMVDGVLPITDKTPLAFPLFSLDRIKAVTPEMLRSPAFKRWFGKSAIRTGSGKPLVVFHGSPAEFYAFDNGKIGGNTGQALTGLGHFFALDELEAQGYTRGTGNVKSYYLKIERPLVIHSWLLPNFKDAAEARAWAKRQKDLNDYDGLYIKDQGHLVAFDDLQMKSAEYNTGDFDSENPDVRYSIAEEETQEERRRREVREMLENILGEAHRQTVARTTKVKTPADAGKKVLEKSRTEIGNVSPSKVVKRFQGYEEMVAALRNERADILEKQRLLAQYIERFPREVRGTYGLAGVPSQIAAAKKDGERIRIMHNALRRINQAHGDYTRRKALVKMTELIKKNLPKLKGNIARQTTGGYDLYSELKEIARVMRMTPEQVEQQVDGLSDLGRLERRVDSIMTRTSLQPGQTREQQRDEIHERVEMEAMVQLRRLSVFGALRKGNPEDAITALHELEGIIAGKKSSWYIEIRDLIRRRQVDRTEAVNVVTGGKGLKTEVQRQADEKKREKFATRIAEQIRGFDDKHQSWEWLLDKLSRLDGTARILASSLVKKYGSLVHRATYDEHTGTRQELERIKAKREEIFGLKGRALEKRLIEDSAIIEASGVWLRDPLTGRKTFQAPMSQNQAYKRWMEWQDPSLQDSLTEQGYGYDTISEIERFMRPEVKRWAQWQLDEFYPGYYDSVNKVFKRLFSTDMPFNASYSPIKRLYAKGKEDSKLLTNVNPHSTVVAGGVKNRTANHREILLQDGDAVLIRHIMDMEHFKAWADPMRELRATLGSEQFRMAVKDHHGDTALEVLDTFLDDFARGRGANDVEADWTMYFRGAFTTAVLGLNPVVFLKQLTAIPAYALDIPVAEWIRRLPRTAAKARKAYGVLRHSEMLKARWEEGFERDMIAAMSKSNAGQITGNRKAADRLMIMIKTGDRLSVLFGGWPVYEYHLDKALAAGKTREEAEKIAMEEFERSTERTQQAGNIKDLMHYQRGGPWLKMFTMFMTGPSAYYRQWAGAIRHLLGFGGDKKDAAKRLVITHFVLPAVFQFVASGFKLPTDDDDWWENVLLGPLQGVVFVRDIVGNIANAIGGKRIFNPAGQAPFFSTVNDAVDFVREIKDYIKKPLDEWLLDTDLWDVVVSGGTIAGNLTGLPFGPASRWATGVVDSATGDTVAPVRRALGYSENKLDTAKADFRAVRAAIREAGKGSPGYEAMKVAEMQARSMTKRVARLREEGAPREEIRRAKEELRKMQEDFVARWEFTM